MSELNTNTKQYVVDFETQFNKLSADIQADLKKLAGGAKNNWSATKRIRVTMRELNKLYVDFREASHADEEAYREAGGTE